MRVINLVIVLFGFFSHAFAGSVIITGSTGGDPGSVISVFIIEDYISQRQTLVQSIETNENKEFNLVFEVNEIRAVILRLGRAEAVMYVEPNKRYEVFMPTDEEASIRKFDKTEVEVKFINRNAPDLNTSIREFNADFSAFISDHYYDFASQEYTSSDAYLKTPGARTKKADIFRSAGPKDTTIRVPKGKFESLVREFNASTNKKFEEQLQNEFFSDYVNYSLAELELMAGKGRKDFYHDYFMSKPIKQLNPAYMRTFCIFYHDFLTNNSTERQAAIVKAINQEHSAQKLVSMFESDSSCLSSEVRKWALLKGLSDIYNNKTYTVYAIEQTLKSFDKSDKDVNVVADNILHQLKKCKEGWLLENFILGDEQNNKWNLSEQTDVPVYMLFYASWNTSSLKEMQMMQMMHEKYGRNFQFVAICMDDDISTFRKYFETHPDQKFTFLYGGKDPQLKDKCNLRVIPQALMVDEHGKVIFQFTRLPSEGLKLDLDKLIEVKKASGQGPKDWRGKN